MSLMRFINSEVVVKTTDGGKFVGNFSGYDPHMNVILKDTHEVRVKTLVSLYLSICFNDNFFNAEIISEFVSQ